MKKRWRYAILAIFALGLVVLFVGSRPVQTSEREMTSRASADGNPDVKIEKFNAAQDTAERTAMIPSVTSGTNITEQEPDILPGHLVNRFHPGLNDAYQHASLMAESQLLYFCKAQLLTAGGPDATGAHNFEYDYTETYTDDGRGFLVLDDVDLTPSNEEAPSFYECLKSERLRTGLRIPISPSMKVGKTIRMYESGKTGVNVEGMTVDLVTKRIADVLEDLSEMAPDDPYRESTLLDIALYRCYLEKGLALSSQIACLRAASGRP